MKKILLLSASIFAFYTANSQTTAMDFTQTDCNGTTSHHLFQDLDEGNVVILEFFMNNCGSCIVAGGKLETLKADLLAEFPGRVKSYAFGFTNSYSCSTVAGWVSNNGFTSIPMNNGASQVAYYGGMGMPTIVILGGSDHAVLGTPYIGFVTSDTTTMSNDIHTFFATQASVENIESNELKIYPNPVNETLMLDLSTLGVQESIVEVRDLTGRIVYSNNINSSATFQLNTSKFTNGQYIVSVKNDSAIFTTKFEVIH